MPKVITQSKTHLVKKATQTEITTDSVKITHAADLSLALDMFWLRRMTSVKLGLVYVFPGWKVCMNSHWLILTRHV